MQRSFQKCPILKKAKVLEKSEVVIKVNVSIIKIKSDIMKSDIETSDFL